MVYLSILEMQVTKAETYCIKIIFFTMELRLVHLIHSHWACEFTIIFPSNILLRRKKYSTSITMHTKYEICINFQPREKQMIAMYAAACTLLKVNKTTYFRGIRCAEAIKKLLKVDIPVSLCMLMYTIGPQHCHKQAFLVNHEL